MRLTKIKISGFKSFVDPITVSFRSNLSGVVGPNGCGKSNIIDAIRWVMGESSAKNLRGESMADVIFNGSSTRKPVGMASVNLIFDNHSGQFGGEWAKFSEISVTRTASRDGQSQYYLNQSRCRRKDILDLFSGTGVGPNSYSIISQGIVSRLIEAKPLELRNFVEEAAGTAIYKRRRHETDLRMGHTRENLERVQAVTLEKERLVKKLKKQSESAEQYQMLQAELDTAITLLAGLKYAEYQAELEQFQTEKNQQQTELLQAETIKTQAKTEWERVQVEQLEREQAFLAAQESFFEAKAAAAQFETELKHLETQKNKLSDQQAQLKLELQALEQQSEQENHQLNHAQSELTKLAPEQLVLQANLQDLEQRYQSAHELQLAGQQAWEKQQADYFGLQNELNLLQQQQSQLSRQLDLYRSESNRLIHEKNQIDLIALETQISAETDQLKTIQFELDQANTVLENLEALQVTQSEQQSDFSKKIADQLASIQTLQLEKTALEARQQAELEQAALTQNYIAQSELVSAFGPLDPDLLIQDMGLGNLLILDHEPSADQTAVQVPINNLRNAFLKRSELPKGAYFVTPEGHRMAEHWCFLQKQFESNADDLNLKAVNLNQNLHALINQINISESELQIVREQSQQLAQEQTQTLKTIQDVRQKIKTLLRRQSDQSNQLTRLTGKLKHLESRVQHIDSRVLQITQETQSIQTQQQNLSDHQQQVQIKLSDQKIIYQAQLTEKQSHQHNLEQVRQAQRSAQQAHHTHGMMIQKLKTQIESLSVNLERLVLQKNNLESKQNQIFEQWRDLTDPEMGPIAKMQQAHHAQLAQVLKTEQALSLAKDQFEAVKKILTHLETTQKINEQAIRKAEQKIADCLTKLEVLKTKQSAVLEQLNIPAASLIEILNQACETQALSIAEQAKQVQVLQKKIDQLGPVNLAAMQEYQQEQEQWELLVRQCTDLTDALEILEKAIAKIDQETKVRFKQTFEKIREHFGLLFPKLFGGGEATLKLDHEDWLTAGVQVMARPPGKKNSSIHLLSGGEKALTAVALVFSIFQINPAPFCLLDEVDAPLDDQNVIRFSQLIKEMSDAVQFIFITHNKLTMDIANQLFGVTMKEPGVSRLVSVDLATAQAVLDPVEVI